MRVLVTGGAGFIGSHTAELLLAEGHKVAIVDNLSTGHRDQVPARATFFERDIRDDCSDIFDEFRPELLSHQAAQMDVRRSVREPDFDADVNVVGTLRLLQSCIRHGVRRVIFASSGGAIYGDQNEFPAREDHPQFPVAPYGVSKLAGERYLHFYEVEYGLRYSALRYGNVYGPRQDPHGEAGVVAIFAERMRSGLPSSIFGTGEQTRDYVYVGDVARANLLALQHDGPSGPFNIGTGLETTVNRLHELMQQATDSRLAPVRMPPQPGEQLRSSIDPTKARTELGWEPAVHLADGLRLTLEPTWGGAETAHGAAH